jgi:hypothetical protein
MPLLITVNLIFLSVPVEKKMASRIREAVKLMEA